MIILILTLSLFGASMVVKDSNGKQLLTEVAKQEPKPINVRVVR